MPRCKSCKKEIVWRKHVASRQSMPIDLVPVAGGNIAVLDGEEYYVVPAAERAGRLDLHKSHYSTCPFAKGHRKAK